MMTQIEHARAGQVTAEIEAVARDEQLDPALVRDEVARGRMVIPANKVHLAKGLHPIGIGMAARTKINANIGKSAVSSDSECELAKLHCGGPLRSRHGDGPLDRSGRSTRSAAGSSRRRRCRLARCPSTRWLSNSTTSSTCGRRISWTW